MKVYCPTGQETFGDDEATEEALTCTSRSRANAICSSVKFFSRSEKPFLSGDAKVKKPHIPDGSGSGENVIEPEPPDRTTPLAQPMFNGLLFSLPFPFCLFPFGSTAFFFGFAERRGIPRIFIPAPEGESGMCCFARPVVSVENTRIFGRLVADSKQALVYRMNFESHDANAMILPLPVRPGSGERAVEFVSFKQYDRFFDDLEDAFPRLESFSPPVARGNFIAAPAAPLVVHEVGDFVASFVPTMEDFPRLDPRFVIPKESWQKIPGYEDYGFAVFQLTKRTGSTHPMAFTFESRWNDRVFFPTVHIHDGEVHDFEDFDHELFAQFSRDSDAPAQWVKSRKVAADTCRIQDAHGFLEPQRHLYRLRVRGPRENRDIFARHSSRGGLGNRSPSATRPAVGRLGVIPTGVGLGLTWLIRRRDELGGKGRG